LVTATATAPRTPLRIHPRAVIGDVGRVVVAGLDGLLVGLIAGFIALTAFGAPANHIGVQWPLAILVVGLAVGLAALLGAGIAMAIAAAFGWLGRHLTGPLARYGHGRLAAMVGIPFRIVASLPAGRIGGFAVLLWIALVGRPLGPLGVLTPPGILSTFVYAAGVVGALAWMAREVMEPSVGSATPPAPGRLRRGSAGLLVVAAGAIAVAMGAYAAWPGTTASLVAYDPAFDGAALTVTTDLDDPGAPGPYEVDELSYGSGTDRHRPAFAAGADLLTPTVDAAGILDPLDGGADTVRAWWWGFGTDALPINGLAWVPRGEGPFPLVLIVHGNHAMGDFSENGYAYLGEHFASRGFITVAVDEDFLNGSWASDWQGDEQLARAWLLLLHVDQWRTWDADPRSPFHERVDLERVALVGHSRGGEASSVAAMLAGQATPPRAGMEPWPTDLAFRAVVSIAPSDGQYSPAPTLDGVDFLTLQSGYDSDARAWSGIRQYARTTPRVGGFKAAFWSYRSNHGQFNTVWGRSDHGPYGGAQLNLEPILPPAEQQDIARTAIGAFLEASLHDQAGYRGLFQRPMAGRAWLPEDIYLVRSSEDPGVAVPLVVGGSQPAVDGTTVSTDGVAATSAMPVPMRALQPDQSLRAVIVRWSAGDDEASWGIDGLDAADLVPDVSGELRFALADGTPTDAGPALPLAVTIEASDRDGTTVRIPMATFGALPPPLPVQLAKHDGLMAMSGIDLTLRSPAERVLQTYAIPLRAFEAADPAFVATDLTSFRLRFDRAAAGAVWIADVAIAH
jgi:hypothetical protein